MTAERPNDDFPIAFVEFSSFLKGTDDEVWIVLMRQSCGMEKHTEKGWWIKLQSLKS